MTESLEKVLERQLADDERLRVWSPGHDSTWPFQSVCLVLTRGELEWNTELERFPLWTALVKLEREA